MRPWGGQGPLPTHEVRVLRGCVCPSHPRMPCSSHSICSRGTWTCQQSAHCPSTCTLYGEGHVVTFDGQRFVFDGNCEYILATVSAGLGHRGPQGAWGATGPAPPQRRLPTGRLRRQRLAAHLQDPYRECRVWEVGRHLLTGHQDLPGGEQAGGLPNLPPGPQGLASRGPQGPVPWPPCPHHGSSVPGTGQPYSR